MLLDKLQGEVVGGVDDMFWCNIRTTARRNTLKDIASGKLGYY